MAENMTKMPTRRGSGVCIKGIKRAETKPSMTRVTRSPRQEATAGTILSGSRLNLWQITTRAHMNEPRNKHEREAAVIEVAATMIRLIDWNKNSLRMK